MQSFGHRYRWTIEEKMVVGVLAVVSAGLILWALLDSNWAWITAIPVGLLAGYAYHLGRSRKTKSTLNGSFDPETDIIRLGGHDFQSHRNKVPLSKVSTVTFRKMDKGAVLSPRDQVVFTATGTNMRVPIRLFSDRTFYDLTHRIVSEMGNDKVLSAVEYGRSYQG